MLDWKARRVNGGRSSVGRAPGCGPGGRGFEPHRSPQPPIDADTRSSRDRQSNGPLAQLVEQWTLNPLVLGSNPRRPTKQDKGLRETVTPFSLPWRTGGAPAGNNWQQKRLALGNGSAPTSPRWRGRNPQISARFRPCGGPALRLISCRVRLECAMRPWRNAINLIEQCFMRLQQRIDYLLLAFFAACRRLLVSPDTSRPRTGWHRPEALTTTRPDAEVRRRLAQV